ncbi:hypothetical protein ACQY0O_000132 [Thecaphora frezii]
MAVGLPSCLPFAASSWALAMFRNVHQPPLVSLFSSTSSSPLALFSAHIDPNLPEDSGALLLRDCDDAPCDYLADDGSPSPRNPDRFRLRTDSAPDAPCTAAATRGLLEDSVLHIQSPTIRTTFIRTPPLLAATTTGDDNDDELGIRLPYLHLQFRPIGSRPFLIEVGIRDVSGRRARIRLSNFQARPTLYLAKATHGAPSNDIRTSTTTPSARQGGRAVQEGKGYTNTPVLHLPITLPPTPETSETSFTPWLSVCLSLSKLIPHFSNALLVASSSARGLAARSIAEATEDGDKAEGLIPRVLERFDGFHSIAYVQVHANLRVRRIWCTKEYDSTSGQGDGGVDELEVFAAAAVQG